MGYIRSPLNWDAGATTCRAEKSIEQPAWSTTLSGLGDCRRFRHRPGNVGRHPAIVAARPGDRLGVARQLAARGGRGARREARGSRLELGWHPCLTLDRPIAPAGSVPSLIQKDGAFWPLGAFLKKLFFGRIAAAEIEVELCGPVATLPRAGGPAAVAGQRPSSCERVYPSIASCWACFGAFGRCRSFAACANLGRCSGEFPAPQEAHPARLPRTKTVRLASGAGFSRADCLMGITDPRWIGDPRFLVRGGWKKRQVRRWS